MRIKLTGDKISKVDIINTITGEVIKNVSGKNTHVLYPAKHFITNPEESKDAYKNIQVDLKKRIKDLKKAGKELEAHRLKQKVTYDLEMIAEVGYVKGIENYSRYFDGREPGDPPYTLLDYFDHSAKNNWLTFIDEGHITFPQVRGMYAGDRSRKKTLIEYGFRLPSALDNRPLKFEEFIRRIPGFIATSATPSDWEINMANDSFMRAAQKGNIKEDKNKGIVQQLLRPTGIPDPKVKIKPIKTQVADVIEEIKSEANKGNRTLVTTLTKKTAEDLSDFLKEKDIKVQYLHSDVKTLERSDILDDLRKGNYECLVGVNLLREGLDLPEVALVAILDADKEGFLRSEVSLVQTMGRAARHVDGRVILYADKITGSMERALSEIERRRQYQIKMNKKLGITPRSIQKPLRERLIEKEKINEFQDMFTKKKTYYGKLPDIDLSGLTPMDKKRLVKSLRNEMKLAAKDLNFELAIEIRDKIRDIET